MSTKRPTLLHRLEFGLYQAVELVLGKLAFEDCVRLGRAIGSIIHLVSARYRRLVRRNLRIATACDAPTREALDELVLETFRRGCANFIASLRSPLVSVDELMTRVDRCGLELLERADGGLVIAMPHMGNWEALSRLGSRLSPNRPYGGVYRPLDNPLMDELTRRRRTSGGALLFSRRDGFHAPSAHLRAGGALAVLADQRAGASGAAMPFFGKMTTCSPLPDLMARRSRAALATLSISSTDSSRWTMEMWKVAASAGTPAIMAEVEKAMRRSLPDVFWFHDRWRTDSGRPLSFFTRHDPAIAATATVPLRLLFTTPSDADEGDVEALLGRMFQIRPDLRIERLAAATVISSDPRVILHPWDPTTPPEQCDGVIQRIDEAHTGPLDGALFFGGEHSLAWASRRSGLRAIVGLDVSGKPWSQSFPRPCETSQWRHLADQLAWIPQRRTGL